MQVKCVGRNFNLCFVLYDVGFILFIELFLFYAACLQTVYKPVVLLQVRM